MFLARQPGEVAAAVRTTVAVTGVTTQPAAGNVIPSLATAQLNFRYLPGQSPTSYCLSRHASLLPHDAYALQSVVSSHKELVLGPHDALRSRPCHRYPGRSYIHLVCDISRTPSHRMVVSGRALPESECNSPHVCCGSAGEKADFAESYVQTMLPKHAGASVHMHVRHEMASPVTPVNGSAFAVVHQAIQETLASSRVKPFPHGLSSSCFVLKNVISCTTLQPGALETPECTCLHNRRCARICRVCNCPRLLARTCASTTQSDKACTLCRWWQQCLSC